MKEIANLKLDNEMDIILAHKRAMKFAELCGCSLVLQTTVATAVSEIARGGVEFGKFPRLHLYIDSTGGKRYLISVVRSVNEFDHRIKESIEYARRLVNDVKLVPQNREHQIILRYPLNFPGLFTENKISSIINYFESEPPLSFYDELRRKNQQLQDMAEKIKESENEYKILSDTLPLMMFSASNRGSFTFTNTWLQNYFGQIPKDFSAASWQNLVHPADVSVFIKDLNASISRQIPLSGQYRFKQRNSSSFLWHMMSIIPLKNEKEIVIGWIGFLVDINAQKLIEQTLKDNKELKETQNQLFQYQDELERKVVELNRSNYELEQFAHLASHDLQEPLRKLFFYSDLLRKKYGASIDQPGQTILNNMTQAAARMRELIQDLLSYSQLHKQKLAFEKVDLAQVVHEIIKDLDLNIKEKEALINVSELPTIQGNPLRLRQLFMNLISNSLKYSRVGVHPVIKIESAAGDDAVSVKVTDNGIGFDPQYSEKIFGLFERLHSRDEFPGTGIGLSICKKIAELHGGNIKAVSKPNEFSTFEVQFPIQIVQV